jgi:hypothetical protein
MSVRHSGESCSLIVTNKLCCPEHAYAEDQQGELRQGFRRLSLLVQFRLHSSF